MLKYSTKCTPSDGGISVLTANIAGATKHKEEEEGGGTHSSLGNPQCGLERRNVHITSLLVIAAGPNLGDFEVKRVSIFSPSYEHLVTALRHRRRRAGGGIPGRRCRRTCRAARSTSSSPRSSGR